MAVISVKRSINQAFLFCYVLSSTIIFFNKNTQECEYVSFITYSHFELSKKNDQKNVFRKG